MRSLIDGSAARITSSNSSLVLDQIDHTLC
jgi:hypothetical protein